MLTKEKNIKISSLNLIKKDIEKKLNIRVIKIKKISKKNCSTKNVFFVNTISKQNLKIKYFLKFNRDKNIKDEIKGAKFIGNFIKTPKIILFSEKTFNYNDEWVLFEFVDGYLMSNIFMKAINNPSKIKSFYVYEKLKELNLRKLHSQKTKKINYTEYLESRTNKLFYKRLFGHRYKEFYGRNKKNISSKFDRRIFINGNELPFTINQIISNIKEKYKDTKTKSVQAIMGHGDVHHGNIILNKDVYFIDNEYAGYIPPFMDLAKAYYNDYLGILFFHYHDVLNKLFKIEKYMDNGEEIHIAIKTSRKIDYFIEVVKIKLLFRKNTINRNTRDFISLNDYLVLCHMLTKNPNLFSKTSQRLFIVFAILLASFDPFKPNSIYKYL
jgi:thiamine kinase-like enzyme